MDFLPGRGLGGRAKLILLRWLKCYIDERARFTQILATHSPINHTEGGRGILERKFFASGALHMRTQVIDCKELMSQDASSPSVWLIGKWVASLNSSLDLGSPEDISSHFASGVCRLLEVVPERGRRECDILQPFLLVVYQKENGNYERVGLMTVETDVEITRHLRGCHERTFVLPLIFG